jgi:hypothetical protein
MRNRSRRHHCRIVRSRVARALIIMVGFLSAALLTPQAACALEAGSRISGSFGFQALADDDMQSTYGMLPMLGLRWTSPLGHGSEFLLGTGYGWDTGNPYYGQADFVTADRAHLHAIPIELGVRMIDFINPRRPFYLGAAIEYLWIREEAPGGDALDGAASGWRRFSGWGWGAKMLAGPEWRIAGGRFSIGCEVSVGIRSLIIRRGYDLQRVNLSGLTTQALLSAHL